MFSQVLVQLNLRFYEVLVIWVFPKIRGTVFGGLYIKGSCIWRSILGSPCFGKLPFVVVQGLFSCKGHNQGVEVLLGISRMSRLREASCFVFPFTGCTYKSLDSYEFPEVIVPLK